MEAFRGHFCFYGMNDILTNIEGHWYFDRAFGLQRLKNQALFNLSYFYKSLMTPWGRFKTLYFQPLTSWRLSEAV
jgi:hypothetical protein